MKKRDKERRKKKKNELHGGNNYSRNGHDVDNTYDVDSNVDLEPVNKSKDLNTESSTHTEIRTDDFVVRSLYVNYFPFFPFILRSVYHALQAPIKHFIT